MSEEIAQQLRQAREARGEHLNEVRERSGISMAILKGLEAARFDTVEPIYMRMGLRSYSEYLELDTEVLLAAFDRDVATNLPAVPIPPSAPPDRRGGNVSSLIRRPFLAGGTLLAILVIAWIVISRLSDDDEPESALVAPRVDVSTELESTESRAPTNAEVTVVTAVESVADPLADEGLVLEVEAIDSTWVQVSLDGMDSFQGTLVPGLKHRWVAREDFFVRSGRAHGARYWLQGKLLGNGRLGEATKVLRFRANSDGVTLLGPELEPLPRTPPTTSAAEQ